MEVDIHRETGHQFPIPTRLRRDRLDEIARVLGLNEEQHYELYYQLCTLFGSRILGKEGAKVTGKSVEATLDQIRTRANKILKLRGPQQTFDLATVGMSEAADELSGDAREEFLSLLRQIEAAGYVAINLVELTRQWLRLTRVMELLATRASSGPEKTIERYRGAIAQHREISMDQIQRIELPALYKKLTGQKGSTNRGNNHPTKPEVWVGSCNSACRPLAVQLPRSNPSIRAPEVQDRERRGTRQKIRDLTPLYPHLNLCHGDSQQRLRDHSDAIIK